MRMAEAGFGGDGRPLPSEEVARQYEEYLAWSAGEHSGSVRGGEGGGSDSSEDEGTHWSDLSKKRRRDKGHKKKHKKSKKSKRDD